MNYISQIRAFYDVLAVKRLSTGQIALWHALMDRNNRNGWVEWFTVANISLELSSGLSRQGIVKSRNALKQAGLIEFSSNGTKATSYKVTMLYSVQAGLQDSVQDSSALYKPKTKTKKDILTDISMKRFLKPTVVEIVDYCLERDNGLSAQKFFDYYESKGWVVGKSPMKDWKAAVRNWEQNSKQFKNNDTENPYLRGLSFDFAGDADAARDDIYCLPELSEGKG